MRNLLALVGLVLVLFVAVGWFRGWYTFQLSPGKDGRTDFNVSVDTSKMNADRRDGTSKVGDFIDGFKKPDSTAPTSTAPTSTASPAAGLPGPKALK